MMEYREGIDYLDMTDRLLFEKMSLCLHAMAARGRFLGDAMLDRDSQSFRVTRLGRFFEHLLAEYSSHSISS
jgi:hypothetical protein